MERVYVVREGGSEVDRRWENVEKGEGGGRGKGVKWSEEVEEEEGSTVSRVVVSTNWR